MKPKKNQRTSAVKIATIKRRNMVMKMRLSGATLRDIAIAMPQWAEKEGIPLPNNYDYRSVYMDIDRELIKTDNQNKELRLHLLSLESERLDYLFRGMWNDAVGGNEHKVDRVLKIMDRRAKYFGLDAPTNINMQGNINFNLEKIHELLEQPDDIVIPDDFKK